MKAACGHHSLQPYGASRCRPRRFAVSARRFAVSALGALRCQPLFVVFDCPGRALGFWSFPRYWVVLGRSVAGPSEDFGDVLEQFRPRLQWRFQASRQIRDTIGSGKACTRASSTINRAVIPPGATAAAPWGSHGPARHDDLLDGRPGFGTDGSAARGDRDFVPLFHLTDEDRVTAGFESP